MALELEVSILEALLRRHRPNHGRTVYYRRLQMVIKCCNRLDIVNFRDRFVEYDQSRPKNQKLTTMRDDGDDNGDDDTLKYLRHCLLEGFTELISRIEHASSAFFIEMSRGFFLPMCTVAVAAMARIRVLIRNLTQEMSGMRILEGKDAEKLQEIVASISSGASVPSSESGVSFDALRASLGMSSKSNCTNKVDEGILQENHKDDVRKSPNGIETNSAPGSDPLKHKAESDAGTDADEPDLGDPIVTESSRRAQTASEIVDRNMEMLRAAKDSAGVFKSKQQTESRNKVKHIHQGDAAKHNKAPNERKRKLESPDTEDIPKKAKKRKKKKKKEKRDVMDEIFGDL